MGSETKTLYWQGNIDGSLMLLDQRKLPEKLEYLQCTTVSQVVEAVRTLAVRGAPAIGVAAAYGLCVALRETDPSTECHIAIQQLEKAADDLASSRPTAVNLFWAIDRMTKCAHEFIQQIQNATCIDLKKRLLTEAKAIDQEDQAMCRSIGQHGQSLIPDDGAVLTHCNAGALATAGIGTALAPMYTAHEHGKRFIVYVDETRPLLQGSRLTAWELIQAGINTVLVCDNMAASLMSQGKINAVITGADRIAANGDAANKIGTLGVSILAAHYKIPFYIAAPSSTFDLSIESGSDIPIEQRDGQEIRTLGGNVIAPDAVEVYNPAFDVTPAANITAIITEKGLLRPLYTESIKNLMEQT